MPAVSCGSKGMVSCMPTTGHVQKPWGGLVSNARDVGASSHHRQDLMMAWQLDLLARQAWGHARLVFGCVSRGCANAQDWEKKKVKKTTKKKKSEKRTHWFKSPQKHQLLLVLHVSYVCVASVRVGREVRGGGIYRDGIRQVFVGTLQWRGYFGFWA